MHYHILQHSKRCLRQESFTSTRNDEIVKYCKLIYNQQELLAVTT